MVVVALAARTWVRNQDWRSDLTLAEATVAVSPESYKSHLMLANALYEAGAGAADIDRVLAEAEKSVAILAPIPAERNHANALRRSAIWYLAKADLGGAAARGAACRRAIELLERCRSMISAQQEESAKRPGYDPRADPLTAAPAEIDRLISDAYLKLGDTGRALELSARAIESDPGNPEHYRQLAQALIAGGRAEQAIAVLMEGVLLTMDGGLRQNIVDVYQKLAGAPGARCCRDRTGRWRSIRGARRCMRSFARRRRRRCKCG